MKAAINIDETGGSSAPRTMLKYHSARSAESTTILSEREIAKRVDIAWKRHRKLQTLKRELQEEEIDKAFFRDLAAGEDKAFTGTLGSITVEQKPDTVCRVVIEDNVPRAAKLAGESLTDLFTIHPSKGREKSFELNALKLLPKRAAQSLIELLTVQATAWVRFS